MKATGFIFIIIILYSWKPLIQGGPSVCITERSLPYIMKHLVATVVEI